MTLVDDFVRTARPRPAPAPAPAPAPEPAIDARIDKVYYGKFLAVRDSHISIEKNRITGFIGPSGCGKSTMLRSLNRMNDLIPSFRLEGHVRFLGQDIYARNIDPVVVRRHVGMVFQQPNPFSMSIFENVAFGLRLNRYRGDYQQRVEYALRRAGLWDEVKDKLKENGLADDKGKLDEIVENALTRASLWDEVKDRLDESAIGMSGGQQQRLCIARTIATNPQVILMDEPCSALDPISTGKIEDLMIELKEEFSIVIVTHNMQQAARVSDRTAFLMVELDATEETRWGRLVEYDETEKIFTNPGDKRTEDYVSGKVG